MANEEKQVRAQDLPPKERLERFADPPLLLVGLPRNADRIAIYMADRDGWTNQLRLGKNVVFVDRTLQFDGKTQPTLTCLSEWLVSVPMPSIEDFEAAAKESGFAEFGGDPIATARRAARQKIERGADPVSLILRAILDEAATSASTPAFKRNVLARLGKQ